MSAEDKANNVADNVKGKVKEVTGKVTGDEELEAEGKLEQGGSKLRSAAENVKDAVHDTFDD